MDKRSIQITGEITLTAHEQKSKCLKGWNSFLRFMHARGLISRGKMEKLYAKGEVRKVLKKKNIIATAGFNVLAKILTGDYADTGAINYMALGDGVGTPSVSDIALFSEVYRNETASSTTSGAIAILTAFYTEVEVDGTFTEFGNFIDATGVKDSGELWSKIQTLWEKLNTETLTVQCMYTLQNKTV